MLPYNHADDCCVYKMTSWLEHSKYESHKERTEKVSWFFFIFLQGFYSHSVSLDSLSLCYHCKHFSFGQNIFWTGKVRIITLCGNFGQSCIWWPRSFRIWMLLFLCVILVTRSDARTFARVKVPIFSATSFFWLALFSGLEWQKINLVSPVVKKTFAFIWCGILQEGVNWGPSGTLVWLNQQDPEVGLIILVGRPRCCQMNQYVAQFRMRMRSTVGGTLFLQCLWQRWDTCCYFFNLRVITLTFIDIWQSVIGYTICSDD